jgi:hypothetical protein
LQLFAIVCNCLLLSAIVCYCLLLFAIVCYYLQLSAIVCNEMIYKEEISFLVKDVYAGVCVFKFRYHFLLQLLCCRAHPEWSSGTFDKVYKYLKVVGQA